MCSHASSSAKVFCSEVNDDTHAQWHNSKYSVFPILLSVKVNFFLTRSPAPCTKKWVINWPALQRESKLMRWVRQTLGIYSIYNIISNNTVFFLWKHGPLVNYIYLFSFLPCLLGSMFCHKVCERTYINSTKDTTKQELWNLLKTIHLDDKISSKERKRLLGQFYRAHPETFNMYFGELAVSVL